MWHIGVDEAGRGPVLGPLVVTAFALPASEIPLLHEMGITDSKKITKNKRQKMYDWLIETSEQRGWEYHIHTSSPAEIDYAMTLGTLNEHEATLFSHCISKLRCSVNEGMIKLDACDVNATRFGERIEEKLHSWLKDGEWEIDSRHGADEIFPVVGAASILSKVTRDRAVEDLQSKIDFPIGSGYTSDPTTRDALVKLLDGTNPYNELRWGWSTVKVAWSELGKGEVPSRKEFSARGPKPSQRTLWDQ